MPHYFRKNPPVVHAIRYLPDGSNQDEVIEWAAGSRSAGGAHELVAVNVHPWTTYARAGDYIVYGDNGFVVVPAKEFEEKYDVHSEEST